MQTVIRGAGSLGCSWGKNQAVKRKLQLEEQDRETNEQSIHLRLQLEETARERHRQAEARWDQENREAEKRDRDDARRERERDHEREIERQRELQQQTAEAARIFREAGAGDQLDLGGQGQGHRAPFKPESVVRLLLKWQESDADTFFEGFERLAAAHNWPENS